MKKGQMLEIFELFGVSSDVIKKVPRNKILRKISTSFEFILSIFMKTHPFALIGLIQEVNLFTLSFVYYFAIYIENMID